LKGLPKVLTNENPRQVLIRNLLDTTFFQNPESINGFKKLKIFLNFGITA